MTERECLEMLLRVRWPNGITCENCGVITKHSLIEKRKCYSCQKCRTQTYPTAGTIFHKSRTPLSVWFKAVALLVPDPAMEATLLQEQIRTSYKTAWRIKQLVVVWLDTPLGWQLARLIMEHPKPKPPRQWQRPGRKRSAAVREYIKLIVLEDGWASAADIIKEVRSHYPDYSVASLRMILTELVYGGPLWRPRIGIYRYKAGAPKP